MVNTVAQNPQQCSDPLFIKDVCPLIMLETPFSESSERNTLGSPQKSPQISLYSQNDQCLLSQRKNPRPSPANLSVSHIMSAQCHLSISISGLCNTLIVFQLELGT